MSHFWFNLPLHWTLNNVQAVLNVVISIIATVGIFSFARFCWQRSTRNLTKYHDVPVSSLLTVSSPGEAFGVLRFLLHHSLTEKKYRQILYQSIVIIGFSSTAVLSGPIANSASRRGQITTKASVNVSFADTGWNNQLYSDVQWNQTMASLDAANFPLDQLLDFIPGLDTPWVYEEDQWNNTWHAECQYVAQTPLSLYATGNYSKASNFSSIFTEVPALVEVIPPSWFSNSVVWGSVEDYITLGNDTVIKDGLMFIDWIRQPGTASFNSSLTSMTLLIAAIYFHDAPAPRADLNGNTNGSFGTGPIAAASYTRALCELERNASTVNMTNIAFPNYSHESDTLTDALCVHYNHPLSMQSTGNLPIQVPSGPELFRFYQSYLISKDTQDFNPGTRIINIIEPTVQLSTIFLAIVLAVALFVVAALLYHFAFMYAHRSTIAHMPESKLDWLLQSLKEAERVNNNANSPQEQRRRASLGTEKSSPRATFDNAKYRHRKDEWMEYGGGTAVVGEVVIEDDVEMFGSPQFIHVGDKTTLLPPDQRSVESRWHYCSGHNDECFEQ